MLVHVSKSLICIAAIFMAAPSAHANTYPARHFTVVVPFAAGGASDVVARIVTEHMSRTFGQQLVIENIAGADGTKRLTDLGASLPAKEERNPAAFAELVKTEIAHWSPILKATSAPAK